ncbi:MAG: hypothetical protein GY953_52650, partial [bacterium]|nr:hypothetical protein [bacterium]
DTVARGHGTHKKVPAQQAKEIFPQAVPLSTDVVPDIYRKATAEGGHVRVADLDKLELKPALAVGQRVRLITRDRTELHEVVALTDDGFRIAEKLEGALFVFGREVDDFHQVDYQALSMLNISATQELHRLVQQQSSEIGVRDEKIASLEARLAKLEASLAKLANSAAPAPAGRSSEAIAVAAQ